MEILQPQSPFNELHAYWASTLPTGLNPMLMNANHYVPGPRSARKRQDVGPEVVSMKRRRAPAAEPEVVENILLAPQAFAPAAVAFPQPAPEIPLPPPVPATVFQPIPGNPYQIQTEFPPETYFGALSAPLVPVSRQPIIPSVEVVLDDGTVATPLKRINLAPAIEFAPTLRKQLRRSTPIIDIPPALSLPPAPSALIPRPDISRLFPLRAPVAFPLPKPRTWSIAEVIEDEEETNTSPSSSGAQTHQPLQSQVMSVD